MDVLVELARRDDVLGPVQQHVRQPLGDDRSPAVIDDEALAEQPADGDAVLEQRVHPRIRMRVVRRRRAVDRVAAGVRRHRHHGHAVGEPAVDRLQILVIERLLPHHGRQRVDDVAIGDGSVLGDSSFRVLLVFAAEAHQQMRDGQAQQVVLLLTAILERLQPLDADLVQFVGGCPQPIGFRVIQRPHVRLGDGRDRAQDALLAAAGAGAVARDERVVVLAHHQHVAQRRGLRILRPAVDVEAQVLLRRVRQQIEERGAGFVLRVHVLGFLHHPQRLMLAARGDAGGAALTEVRDEDREDAAAARRLLLGRREDRVGLLIGHRHAIEDVEELALGLRRESVNLVGDLPDDLLHRRRVASGQTGAHHVARALLDLRHQPEHLRALAFVGDVVDDRRSQDRLEILRAVRQRRIGTDRDALHALRAVLGNVERRLAARDVLRRRVAAAGRHDPDRRQRRRRLVVAEAGAELLVERFDARQRRALVLTLRNRVRAASRSTAVAVAVAGQHRQQRLAAQRRAIRRFQLTDVDLADELEALGHDLHIRLDDAFAEPAELLDVLPVHHLVELFLIDPEFLEERRHPEEGAEERVALHAELQVCTIRGLARDLEAGQREDADLLVDDLLARPHRQPFPRLLAFLLGFPHQAAALGHPVERIGVRERLGIAAQHHRHVTQIAVDADPLWRGDHEICGRRAFLFRPVFRVRADVDDFLRVAEFVDELVALVEEIVEVADDRAEVLAGRDRAPAADRVEAHRDRVLGQERRCVARLHLVRVIDAEDHEGDAVRRTLAVLARALTGDELVRADRVLGTKVARSQAVDAGEQARHPIRRQRRDARLALHRLVQRGADVAAHRVVAGHRLVGALEDDDVLLARERLHDRRLRERTDDVEMDRSDRRARSRPQIVDAGFDVLRRRSERDKHGVRVLGLVLGDEAVVAAGQLAEVLVGVFEEFENRLGEVVAAGDDALHVVLLVLHGTEEHGIGEVDHFRHAAAPRPEEHALALRRTLDHIVGRSEIPPDQLRFVLVERSLEMRGEEAVLDVHPGREAELGHAAQDERLVGGLLRVLAEHHDPAGVERAVDVVMAAVHVQRVLGQRARGDLEHHRRALAGRVVVLLHAINDALARGVVDDPLAANGVGDRSALRRMFAFGLHGDGVAAEDVQLSFCVRLLVKLAALSRRCDWVEDTAICDTGFSMVGHQLIAVGGYADPGIARSRSHESSPPPTGTSLYDEVS